MPPGSCRHHERLVRRSASAYIDVYICLRGGAVVALLVAAAGAGGADDNHATALAAVLVGRHLGERWRWWRLCECVVVVYE